MLSVLSAVHPAVLTEQTSQQYLTELFRRVRSNNPVKRASLYLAGLLAISHYLNQCGRIMSQVLWACHRICISVSKNCNKYETTSYFTRGPKLVIAFRGWFDGGLNFTEMQVA